MTWFCALSVITENFEILTERVKGPFSTFFWRGSGTVKRLTKRRCRCSYEMRQNESYHKQTDHSGCTLYLFACQVTVIGGNSSFWCCVRMLNNALIRWDIWRIHDTNEMKRNESNYRQTGIVQWLERRTLGWRVTGSNPCRSGGRIFLSRVNFLCWLLFRHPFHPRVTAGARKRSRSFCRKRWWQVTVKHACTLRL